MKEELYVRAEFTEAFINTNAYEGLYVNNPFDRGGETYAGISRRYWEHWEGWEIVDAIKCKASVENLNYTLSNDEKLNALLFEFYQDNFWKPNSLMLFPQSIANELYDSGVNQGVEIAAQHLQRALNLLNRNERDFKDLKVDGKIGMKTMSAFYTYMKTAKWATRSKHLCEKWLVKLLDYFQCARYVQIVEDDPAQELFLPGWMKRI